VAKHLSFYSTAQNFPANESYVAKAVKYMYDRLKASCVHFVVAGDDAALSEKLFDDLLTKPVYSVAKDGSPAKDMCLLKQSEALIITVHYFSSAFHFYSLRWVRTVGGALICRMRPL
jgi:hypothetical protein